MRKPGLMVGEPLAGYASSLYARALCEFGKPIELPASGGWLLQREIAGTARQDAMGPYPIFCCQNWERLGDDLRGLERDLVSVVLVADPFGCYDEALLRSCFDRVVSFKKHFLVNLEAAGEIGSRHHRHKARRALRYVTVEVCEPSEQLLREWIELYSYLIQRHSVSGIQAFSDESFRQQFAVPGLVVVRAVDQAGQCLGAQLWYRQGEVAYSHLVAANERGYELACLHAVHEAAIRHFRGQVRWLDLGGGAGLSAAPDGLTRFKEGWSNDSRTVFLCARILDARAYQELSGSKQTEYFPAYRDARGG